MVFTCFAAGLTGLVYILGLLYSTTDISSILAAGPDASIATYVPLSPSLPPSLPPSFPPSLGMCGPAIGRALAILLVSSVFLAGISCLILPPSLLTLPPSRSYVAACGPAIGRALAILLVSNVFLAGISCLTVTSRTAYAMARDEAFPFSDYLKKLHPKLQVCVWCVLVLPPPLPPSLPPSLPAYAMARDEAFPFSDYLKKLHPKLQVRSFPPSLPPSLPPLYNNHFL